MKRYVTASLCLVGILFLIQSSSGALPVIESKSGVEMVQIPAGSFVMGDEKGDVDEEPHEVHIDAFYMDKYLVTQEEYKKVMKENPSRWQGKKNPVDTVRWSDAVKYCNARSLLEGLQPCYDLETWKCDFKANGYRLATEAEWEYACRADTKASYPFGDKSNKLKNYAWFKGNAGGRPRPVGKKLPNPWGLYDMLGNVLEWCNDFYAVDYYQASPEKNPRGPEEGDTKVVRGGSWDSSADNCRSSFRYNEAPGYSDICFGYDIYGFRCVRVSGEEK